MSIRSRFILGHTKQIIKDSIFQFVGISILVGCLLYLLHILVGVSFGVQAMSESIQNKLGVYFYIKDIPEKQDETYSKIIQMKDKLTGLGMRVTYLSKDDAMKSIERKVPSVLESFEKYGIKNPLPATVYVLFSNAKDYDKLRAVITLYQDIISNRDDIAKIGENIKKQEERILHTLGFTHFIVYLSFFLVVVLVVIICAFLMLVIKTKFDKFQKTIHIQKLLGTPYALIKYPFMITTILITIFGFTLSLVLRYATTTSISTYVQQLFETDIFSIIGKGSGPILLLQGSELLVIIGLVASIGYIYMQTLLLRQE